MTYAATYNIRYNYLYKSFYSITYNECVKLILIRIKCNFYKQQLVKFISDDSLDFYLKVCPSNIRFR